MRRRWGRLVAAVLLALVPAGLGTGVVLFGTRRGQETLGRLAGEELSRQFRGAFQLERVSGSLVRSLQLDGLVIRDTAGEPFASVRRLRVRYALPSLLAGRFVFTGAELTDPDVRLVKRADGRLNLHEIFRLNEGPEGGASPLVEFRNIRIRGGALEIRLPWSPPDTARTPEAIARALAEDRARPARIILQTPDGLRRVVTFADLNARVPLFRVSSPDRTPLTFDVDSLTTRVSDPAVHVLDLAAHGWTRGDSLALTVHRASLPNSRLSGGGVLTWPNGPIRYDLVLDATRLDLNDLHWISPDFPALSGRALVTLRSPSDQLAVYRLDALELAGPPGRLRGGVTVLADAHRGIGVEDMDLVLNRLDLDVPRPYLDTLALHGSLDGRLSGRGFRDGLDLDADLIFRDADVAEAETWLRGRGRVVLGGPDGPVFDSVVVAESDVDLGSVRRLAPGVQLRGRLALQGVLRGAWRNVTFEGGLRHRDGEHPESRGEGLVALDTRGETARFDARLDVAPLAFDGLRPSYPNLTLGGAASGFVGIRGTTDSFRFVSTVQGDPGAIVAQGLFARAAGRVRLDSTTVRFAGLNLAAVSRTARPTALSGQLRIDGVYDSTTGPEGRFEADLGRGRVAELPLDSLHVRLQAGGGRLDLDTLVLRWPAGQGGGSGTLAWRAEAASGLRFGFAAESLGVFEPFLSRALALDPDSGGGADALRGRAHGEVEIGGSVVQPRVLVWSRGEDFGWRGLRSSALAVSLGLSAGDRPELGAALQTDSLTIRDWRLRDVGVVLGGYQDSLRWMGGARLAEGGGVIGAGESWTTSGDRRISLDSLTLSLARHAWRLRQPTTLTLGREATEVTPLRLDAADGSGALTLTGAVPRAGAGALTVGAVGLDLRDLYALLGRDTAGVEGTLELDLAIGGTAARPTIRGGGSVTDLAFGDVGSPFVQGIVDYADRRLETTLLLWRTGRPVVRLEAALPLDLALRPAGRRQVDGPLMVRALADSTDLVIAEAFTPNLRRVRGTLRADVRIDGTWEAPRLGGTIELQDASATVPGLGVRYTGVTGAARLAGDSIQLDSLSARGGEGTLRITGGLRLERLTRPILGLSLRARRFRLIDVRRFLTLDASGQVQLTGPVFGARLTGRVTADAGNLHFADLITKRIVDLENPGDSGLIDLDLVRAERLGADFESRFLDSLTIDALRVQMGESFWLRSNEANIQLDGDLTVAKVRDRYRYDGTLNAVRGSYALRIGGLVTREFTVERGTVRYFGTPDLNADLDIEAHHTVLEVERSEEIPVIARITGTMLQPRLELVSPPTASRPALSQTELVSYLMFGRPTFSLQSQAGGQGGGQVAAVEAGLSYLSSALSNELQRALITDLGVPIDYIDIRTGGAGTTGLGGGPGGSAQVAQVAAGWQVGRRWFVTVVADLCTNAQRFYPKSEFRMTRALRLKTSVEPAYSCQVALNQPALSVNKYQVGLDLLWEREY